MSKVVASLDPVRFGPIQRFSSLFIKMAAMHRCYRIMVHNVIDGHFLHESRSLKRFWT